MVKISLSMSKDSPPIVVELDEEHAKILFELAELSKNRLKHIQQVKKELLPIIEEEIRLKKIGRV